MILLSFAFVSTTYDSGSLEAERSPKHLTMCVLAVGMRSSRARRCILLLYVRSPWRQTGEGWPSQPLLYRQHCSLFRNRPSIEKWAYSSEIAQPNKAARSGI
jgi:hypothetical protein